ncbi:MAG: AAA family ATPase [Succinivibrionaceae bacterium]|nr:AAA family ATPase [Succinivibrionaceae bacterium]
MPEERVELLGSPYGDASYELIRKFNRAFADKSGMIRDLDDKKMPRFPVLLRPRRFGKSTFVQMLKCFYDVSYADRYEQLFAGTAIHKASLESHNSYHVLDLEFSKIYSHDEKSLIEGFVICLENGISDFMKRYPDFRFEPGERERSAPAYLLTAFLTAYDRFSSQQRLYLMIDEYDNFANNLLSSNLELFKAITSSGGFLKDFYASIKDGTVKQIARTFITGVSSVSLDSLTSGFNISRNVTARGCFNNYAGLTERELRILVPQLVDVRSLGVGADEIIERMKPVYDGYCFSRHARNTVYNSSMCLYYLDEVNEAGEFLPPEKYLDPASDHDGKKLQQLFGIAEDGLTDTIIGTYLAGGVFFIDGIDENINLNQSSKYSKSQLLSMLYYLGYLTIDPKRSTGARLALKIPNLFMSRLFARCVVDLRLKPSDVFRTQKLDISSMLASSDDISDFAVSCTEFLSAVFTSQVLAHMSEMALNLLLYAKLDSMDEVSVELQKSLRVVGKGEKFADLVIAANEGQSDECVYIIELKYAAKGDISEAKLAKLREEAADQVSDYRSALEFRDKLVKSFVMIFSGCQCVYCG